MVEAGTFLRAVGDVIGTHIFDAPWQRVCVPGVAENCASWRWSWRVDTHHSSWTAWVAWVCEVSAGEALPSLSPAPRAHQRDGWRHVVAKVLKV